ncbi:unnamed protein product [Rhizoctonia solani]|uniref:BTB domain-containing protein n=1 Tax=Rhizoctonia solani TaxID=456999 RepID=A0A8H3H945_9AGAM|nr:unnamed protein product [Rhizoctonia solani]
MLIAQARARMSTTATVSFQPPATSFLHQEEENEDEFVVDFDAEDEFIITGGKHERFWLEDGNVVLVAKPPSQTQFRVHQSVLSRQSPVFKELFSYPSRAKFERIQGCPVVPLGDTEEDITALLSALYDGLTLQRNSVSDIENISGQLRLATKYQISNIRDKILAYLRGEYPLDLLDVDRKNHEKEYLYDAITIIQLGVPELLPYAWYILARNSFARHGGDTSRLSNDEMHRLMVGREKLRSHLVTFALSAPPTPHSNFTHPCTLTEQNQGQGWCQSAAQSYWATSVLPLAAKTLDPLQALNKLAYVPEDRFGFCLGCATWCEQVLRSKRTEIWKCVPDYFGLDKVE